MKNRIPGKLLFAALLAFFAVAALAITHGFSPRAAAQSTTQSGLHETTMSDQTDLAVTVYNSNVALVRDTRNLSLPSGEFQLRFMDIAATVNPATVHIRSLADADKLDVLEQDYEYDLLDATKMLQKYVGKDVTLVRNVMKNNSTESEETRATLLANNPGGPVWKIGNEIVTGMTPDGYRFSALPDNLYSRPTLVWMLSNTGARSQKIEASYLANNMSWNADYVMTVARDDNSAGLDGWVTLVNNAGTAFRNAQLQLVAGDLNRVVTPAAPRMMTMGAAGGGAPAPPMTQENFSEYHLYTLTRRTTIADKESKQVSLLRASSFPVEKHFVVNGQNYYYRSVFNPGAPSKDPVMVYYHFKNEEKTGLGMPLPAGTVRVYQADSHGGVLFIGEDRIAHTPKDESLDIHTGNAFDVVAERKQTDYKTISNRVHEMEYEITLRNHKDSAITVEVNEPLGGDWEMLNSSFPYTKTAAFAAQFKVPVAKDGTAVLKYRVRVQY
ncbi:MAG TPA: DUF4139 domain-containing protein [Candidatus Acidoferrales bacterium]|jgi:hypothetical protein|nr:DUF4139 domain-containing protein [Candidatus Acidoferrales bacterium]